MIGAVSNINVAVMGYLTAVNILVVKLKAIDMFLYNILYKLRITSNDLGVDFYILRTSMITMICMSQYCQI